MFKNNIGYIFECKKDGKGTLGVKESFNYSFCGDIQKVNAIFSVDMYGKILVPSYFDKAGGFNPLNAIISSASDIDAFVRSHRATYSVFPASYLICTFDDESITVDELVDNLSVLLDINRVSREQLTQLFILSPYQIESLINYRLKNGGFHSIYEIQLINGFDKKTIDRLLPYISVDNMKENFVPIKKNTRIKNELSLRYDIPLYKREGDYNSFIGPSFYTALRYNCQLKDKIEFGLVAEKDSGEPIFGLDNSCGFDYYSYYLIIKNINKFDKIFIGKFRVNYGLGLTVGTRNFGGKWNEIQSFFKDANGVSKHSSVDEYNYFRGIACIYKSGNLEITPFISHKETGGTIKENKINSIYTSGLYRTAKEIEKKNAVKQVSMGSRIAYHFSNFTLGVNGLYYYFNLPIGRSTKNYAKYDIVGNNFFNIGTDYTWYWNKVISKGELADRKSTRLNSSH